MTRPTTEQLIADLRELYNRVFIVNGKEVPTLEAQAASRLELLERVAVAARDVLTHDDEMDMTELEEALKALDDAS